ncbi:MAG: helix-turn-helix transcriptional regulator, partial [Coprobacillus sp.]
MFNYEPFWKTLKEKGISQYKLINEYGIRTSTLDKLRHNKNMEVMTLVDLCKILDCNIEDIIKVDH